MKDVNAQNRSETCKYIIIESRKLVIKKQKLKQTQFGSNEVIMQTTTTLGGKSVLMKRNC